MWQKAQGPDQDFIDPQTNMHVQRLTNSETGATHVTQIFLGHIACPNCGSSHMHAEEPNTIDPKAKVQRDLDMLNGIHESVKAYAAKHRRPIKSVK